MNNDLKLNPYMINTKNLEATDDLFDTLMSALVEAQAAKNEAHKARIAAEYAEDAANKSMMAIQAAMEKARIILKA